MEREEGELTDEDLEDVSDNSSMTMISSVPLIITGKSSCLTAGREPFRELSLTSISDDSEEKQESLLEKNRTSYRLITTRAKEISRDIYRRHKCRREEKIHAGTKRVRKISERRVVRRRTNSFHKQYSSVSSSSEDSDYYKDKTILRQLRDAVRINRSQNLPNCSLRTRIKRMIEPDSQGSKNSNSEDDLELETLRDQALQSKIKSDSPMSPQENQKSVTDDDLIELRLIALQSAVLKKHQNRRKRKEEQQKNLELQQQTAATEENNENAHNEETTEVNSLFKEKDEEKLGDLEQLNQENVENTTENKGNNIEVNIAEAKTNIDDDEDILRAMLLTSISKKISNKKSVKQMNTVISKNNIISNKTNGLITKRINEIKNPIKVPSMPVNRIIINVNSDSDSDVDQTIIEKKAPVSAPKGKDLFDKSLSLFLQQARAKTENQHQSDISHLPRSQQLEYKRLKRKLQLLSTRIKPIAKTKKIFTTPDENKRTKLNNINTKRILTRSKYISATSLNNGQDKSKSSLPLSSNIHDDKQKSNEDRLQIKGKYEELAPLMTKVSEARSARDKAQVEVKRLINDLRIARAELTSTHQTYTVLVQQLVNAKANIDKRLDDQELEINKIKNPPIMCTSTPNKVTLKEITCELSVIDTNQPEQEKLVEENDIPKEIPVVEIMEIVETVPESDKKEPNILKYTSPLDHIQLNREQPLANPLMVLCPYDLLGVCRDPDCAYQHCGNAITD